MTQPSKAANLHYIMTSLDLWHNRLGNRTETYLKIMKQKELCLGLDFTTKEYLTLCLGCSTGNLKRKQSKITINEATTNIFVPKGP